MKKILLTTPDYVPKKGGLTTFTLNIEKTLKDLGIAYDLFHWPTIKSLKAFNKDLSQYDTVINIHSMFGYIHPVKKKYINFIHGSEVTFSSPNLLKRVVKKIIKKNIIQTIRDAKFNICISEYTFKLLERQGLIPDYSRDLIFHNCIQIPDTANVVLKNIEQDYLIFCCIARDVFHKNIAGVVAFCENIAMQTSKRITLYLPSSCKYVSKKIQIEKFNFASDVERDEVYKKSHFNLLLSLEDLDNGFIEGFGLTPLEAACFGTPSIVLNTGGLPESVHNDHTGWVLNDLSIDSIKQLFPMLNQTKYKELQLQCFKHTISSHCVENYQALLASVL